jgi:hypothetical protein
MPQLSQPDDPDVSPLTGKPRARMSPEQTRFYRTSGRRIWTPEEDAFLLDIPTEWIRAPGRPQAGFPDWRAIARHLGVSSKTARERRRALRRYRRDAQA